MRRLPLLVLLAVAAALSGCGSKVARDQLAARGIPFTSRAFLAKVREGDVVAVRQFLSGGVSPRVRDEETRTALMLAAGRADPPIVALLLDAGATVNDRVRRKHWIEIPFMTDTRPEAGRTALMYAIESKSAA